MKILSIETSCDETSAAVLEKKGETLKVLSNITASSMLLHASTGGIIPENAAREQVKMILPVISKALLTAFGEGKYKSSELIKNNIDAIALTHGPGLIGSLLVGVETAKTLSFVFQKPVIPVNHLLAHIFANFILRVPNTSGRELGDTARETLAQRAEEDTLDVSPGSFISPIEQNPFPFIGLIVSGGHTDLLYFKSINDYKWLGGTRDDAAGEAIDKIGRLLGLSYPAGPETEIRASKVSKPKFSFTSPLLHSDDFDFSFSGLKTEAMRFVQKNKLDEEMINQICYSTQKAIIDVLVKKTVRAAELYNTNTILLGGGVSANQTLHKQFSEQTTNQNLKLNIFSPEKEYCTDNAAMIGAYALMNFKPVDWKEILAIPDLYFD